MTYEHVSRFGIYFADLDICVMDDFGNLIEVDFASVVRHAFN